MFVYEHKVDSNICEEDGGLFRGLSSRENKVKILERGKKKVKSKSKGKDKENKETKQNKKKRLKKKSKKKRKEGIVTSCKE